MSKTSSYVEPKKKAADANPSCLNVIPNNHKIYFVSLLGPLFSQTLLGPVAFFRNFSEGVILLRNVMLLLPSSV